MRPSLALGVAVCALGAALVAAGAGLGGQREDWSAELNYPNKGANLATDRDQFQAAAVCGACHTQHYEEWKRSAMARSAQRPEFLLNLFRLGQDLRGAPVDDVQICLQCHAPLATMGPQLDLDLALDSSREGVTCDVCHTAVHVDKAPTPGGLKWDPTGPRRGPVLGTLDEGEPEAVSSFHETARSDLVSSSSLCSSCHWGEWPSNGLAIDGTFDEWQQSPHAEEGRRCQDCHMPTYTGSAAPGAPVRESLHRHDFPGGQDAGMLASVLDLQLSVCTVDGAPELRVRLENTGAGHDFPTGNATAPVVHLDLQAEDSQGRVTWSESRSFGKTYGDSKGQPTVDPTMAVSILENTALVSREPRLLRFSMPQSLKEGQVRAQVTFRWWDPTRESGMLGMVGDLAGRYLSNGILLHRGFQHLGPILATGIDPQRSLEPVVVAEASASLAETTCGESGWGSGWAASEQGDP